MIDIIVKTLPIFVAIFLGFYFRNKKILPENSKEVVAKIAFNICVPALIVNVLYGLKFEGSNAILLVIPIAVMIFIAVVGVIFTKIFGFERIKKGTIVLVLLGFGIGSFAYPFIQLNFENEVFQNVVLMDVVLFFTMLTLGYALAIFFGKERKFSRKIIINKFFKNPIIISMVLVMFINYAGIELSEEVLEGTNFFGRAFGFLAAFLIGLTLYLPESKRLPLLIKVILLRLAIIAFAVFCLLMVVDVVEIREKAILLTFFTPFSTMPVVYAIDQKLDEKLASQLVVGSTLVALVGYPLLIAFLK